MEKETNNYWRTHLHNSAQRHCGICIQVREWQISVTSVLTPLLMLCGNKQTPFTILSVSTKTPIEGKLWII